MAKKHLVMNIFFVLPKGVLKGISKKNKVFSFWLVMILGTFFLAMFSFKYQHKEANCDSKGHCNIRETTIGFSLEFGNSKD